MATLIRSVRSAGEEPRFRVWHAYNVPNNMDYYEVADPKEARSLIRRLALADLRNPSISSNAFGLEELESDGYHEWYDEEGDSIGEEEN